jgi:hypothetical protein
MDEPASPFAVVHHPAMQGHPRLLGRTDDPNEATLLLDREMHRLRKQGRDGEVRLMRTAPHQTIVLRLPLRSRPRRG